MLHAVVDTVHVVHEVTVLAVDMKKDHTEIEEAMEDLRDLHHMATESPTVRESQQELHRMEIENHMDHLDHQHHHQDRGQDLHMEIGNHIVPAEEAQTLNHDIRQKENIIHFNCCSVVSQNASYCDKK